jgi:hypothetical protein
VLVLCQDFKIILILKEYGKDLKLMIMELLLCLFIQLRLIILI